MGADGEPTRWPQLAQAAAGRTEAMDQQDHQGPGSQPHQPLEMT